MNSTDTTVAPPRSDLSQPTPPRGPDRRPRLARWVAAGAGVAVVGLLLGLAGLGPSPDSSGDGGGVGVEVVNGDDLGTDAGPSGQPAADQPAVDQSDVDQSDVDQPDVDQPDVDQSGDPPEAEEPQPPVEPVAATLSVTPDPVNLKTGVYVGSITVANVGDEPMQWAAATKPWVSLSDTTGDLGGHGENVITFTVDESQLDGGSFTFKIKVWGNGGTEYVDVSGAKPFNEVI